MTLVLLHAFPLDHTMWEPQIAALSSRHRIIAPDVRGFGTAQPATPWTIDQAADEIAAQLSKLNVQDFTLVGLSMGGYIALPFYARYSERIRSLVLADTRARADNETERAARTDMIALLEGSGISMLPDKMLPRLLMPNPSPEVVQKVRRIIERTDPAAAIYALMAMRDRPDCSTVLHRITCPTLVIAGEHDAVTRVDECRAMAETIPGGRYVEIANAGHLSNMENPERFTAALNDFLDQD